MNSRICSYLIASLVLTASCSVHAQTWGYDQMVTKNAEGRPVYRAKPVDPRFTNPWPDDWEAQFQQRARHIIAAQSKIKMNGGNTYFENEKRSYGYIMAHILAGNVDEGARQFQIEDAQAKQWHSKTQGIDYYAAFTLKHQMRKYFYFGDLLKPEYRQRMFEGAKAWTARDPLRRPHHAYVGGPGWGPDHKNSWVDVRSTENLFLMRVTSVYLMAEETANRATAEEYKRLILDYAKTLYRIGIGEWDSENYHGHSMAPLCNLYDFAKDPQVKRAAKACLDWFTAAGAVKYYRGGFNGPTKRDYNHVQPFGGSAASMLWVYFGDTPFPNTHWESDESHLITSAYRPPPAVVNLARKDMKKPVEILAAKPEYSATTSLRADSAPQYLETQYIAHSYQMGSLAGGTRPGVDDVNGFKMLTYSEKRGVNAIQCVPGPDPLFVGSPRYQKGKVSAANRVAQYQNLAIWLVEDGASPWLWVLPEEIQISQKDHVTFLKADRTWLAIHPIHITAPRIDDALTDQIKVKGKKSEPHWPDHRVLSAKGQGGKLCGFAIEVGESQSHGGFEAFVADALTKSKLDLSAFSENIVTFTGSRGATVKIKYAPKLEDVQVWRNGLLHNWKRHQAFAYQRADERSEAPIHMPWHSGTLTVTAAGRTFTCTVDDAGNVTFANK